VARSGSSRPCSPAISSARFDLGQSYRAVKHAQNVLRIIEFSGKAVAIADRHIEDIRREMMGKTSAK